MKVDAEDLSYRKFSKQIKASKNNRIYLETCLSKSCNGNQIIPVLIGRKEIPGGNFGAFFNGSASIVRSGTGSGADNDGDIAFPGVDEQPAGHKQQMLAGKDRYNPTGEFKQTFSECFHVAKAFARRSRPAIPTMKNPDKQLYTLYNCKEVISCEG